MDKYEKAAMVAGVVVLLGLGGLGVGIYVEAFSDGIVFFSLSVVLAILLMWIASDV